MTCRGLPQPGSGRSSGASPGSSRCPEEDTPPCPADLRDGGWHLGEVLVPAGNMPPGIVADAGLWTALGHRAPVWPQRQQQWNQQHQGDALGPAREKGQLFAEQETHTVHFPEPCFLSQSPSDVFLLWRWGSFRCPEPPTPPQSWDSLFYTRGDGIRGMTWRVSDSLPSALVRPCPVSSEE